MWSCELSASIPCTEAQIAVLERGLQQGMALWAGGEPSWYKLVSCLRCPITIFQLEMFK